MVEPFNLLSNQGDSGGGMVTSSPITNKIEIVGIVSWGRGCAMPNSPGSYTNVRMFKSFIEKTIMPGECMKQEKAMARNILGTVFLI